MVSVRASAVAEFYPGTRYTIAWRDAAGNVRPATIYVYRVYDAFMIARPTGGDASLRKITYPEVVRIVAAQPVAPSDRYAVPAALLDEKKWGDRVVMARYATSPARVK
jgi:hypothetical protein